MTHYLLDTNIISHRVRNPQGQIAAQIRKVGESRVATSIIVAAELRYGAKKKGSSRLTLRLESVLGALQVMSFEAPADQFYGRLRAELEAHGKPIGSNRSAHRGLGTFLMSTQLPTCSPSTMPSSPSRAMIGGAGLFTLITPYSRPTKIRPQMT
jgi:tRNA(fMet)-specific endonuclease VapC